ncbi:MAG TPA: alpha/beta fold hydrolase [Dehalococcoidia bacterium]|nr:alpha/beta fold hydrolase [Dehalococcoidia bacterium]
MTTYVLIHGAWHGGWCWDKVVPLLERAGHRALAPDLPGHGADKTPIPQVTLQAYADRVCAILDAQPEPVVLVGHSMGGAVISQAAEQRPDGIRTLVYLCAFLLRDGESLLQIAQEDPEALVLPNLEQAEDGASASVRQDALRDVFYADCSDEDVGRATSLLVPQATAPFATPVHTTPESFGRIPRVYIECLRDHAISVAVQRQMYAALPCQRVTSMDTSHSPFFSAPAELARHLTSL